MALGALTKVLGAVSIAAALFAAPARAQQLTADDVAAGFVEAVVLCAKAKLAGGGIAALPDAQDRVSTGGPSERAFLSAPEGRPVWNVLSARGIVMISEPDESSCDVTAYGPRVRPVFDTVVSSLTAAELGFSEREAPQDPSSIIRLLVREAPSVSVRLDGGEPGMPGRTFRFPMLLAFVRAQ